MIIRAADLDPEGLAVDTLLEVGSLRTDADEPIEVGTVALRGRAIPTRTGLVVQGRMTATVVVPCARCTAPFAMEIDRTFHLNYEHAPPGGREIQIPDDDLEVGFLDEEGGIDLTQLAEEQIYLEMPMKPLCGPACRGLCARCGGNLNRGECRCPEHAPLS